jgi:hypothetical protein
MDKIERILYGDAKPEGNAPKGSAKKSTHRIPPLPRPTPEQLAWIYEIEHGNDSNRLDYNRLVRGIHFPLLPCKADPSNADTLSTRTKRIKAMLKRGG